ncbi:MAG: glycosyltransferase [Anaerolineae bacterium]
MQLLRQRLGLPAGRPVLVYLGLLAPYQGTDLLLQAMQRLMQRRPPPHLLLMGFPDVTRYRRLAEQLGLAGHVTFTGAVAYEEAPLHLALGDLAVAPKISATEGSGKLLPYMAAGLPVVAFDTPVHREYLGEWGSYAPAGDAAGLADAIGWALDHPDEPPAVRPKPCAPARSASTPGPTPPARSRLSYARLVVGLPAPPKQWQSYRLAPGHLPGWPAPRQPLRADHAAVAGAGRAGTLRICLPAGPDAPATGGA